MKIQIVQFYIYIFKNFLEIKAYALSHILLWRGLSHILSVKFENASEWLQLFIHVD